jgi:membrane protease YdiL (CAAX protease family)
MHQDSTDASGQVRAVPWSAAEILIALLLVAVFWPGAVYQLLHASGFYRRLYGEAMTSLAWTDPAEQKRQRLALDVLGGSGAGEEALPVLRRWAFYRLHLWAMVLAFPFQAATIPLLLYRASGTRPAQLGLTTHALGRNLLAGALAALVLTPAVLGLNYLVDLWYVSSGAGVPQEHPLTLVAQQSLVPAEWVLLFLTGMMSAPVLEELIFRGMLQSWFAARRWGGHAAMATAFAWALATCWGRARAAWSTGAGPFLEQAAPAVFVLALVPFYLVVRWYSRTPAGPAIFGTALLFALVHASVWPTPVALFFLALGLGGLAWYTRSLAGPIVLHSLFNGYSCVKLLLESRS